MHLAKAFGLLASSLMLMAPADLFAAVLLADPKAVGELPA